MERYYGFRNGAECIAKLGDLAYRTERPYCPAYFDSILCWPAAKADSKVYLPCPPIPALDPKKKAYRVCGPNGLWDNRNGQFSKEGYTYYADCYTEEANKVYQKFMSNKTRAEQEFIRNTVANARMFESVGLCISLITTITSLVIFCYFRSLKCHRTRIHKNLFVAIIVQISMKIILIVDQTVARENGLKNVGASSGDSNTIYDTRIFCEILYSLVEYTKTVKFMWMFIEGLYLHNMIAVSVFSGKPNYKVFYSIGWGVPVLLTIAWVIPMAETTDSKCWYAYYYKPLIWIIEGPRTAVMVVNLFFLLNIIRVLVMKLRESQTNEANKVKKAVKAAIVLLPLLGLTNFVIMLETDGDSELEFAAYTYSSTFLSAFEGFFISLLYCFLNGEVRQTLKRQWDRWRQHRLIHSSSLRRMSRSLSIFTSFTEVPHTSNTQKKQTTGTANGVPVHPANGGPTPSRLPNIFRGGGNSRRQSGRDMTTIPEHQSTIELPDLASCRTDLMCEEKV